AAAVWRDREPAQLPGGGESGGCGDGLPVAARCGGWSVSSGRPGGVVDTGTAAVDWRGAGQAGATVRGAFGDVAGDAKVRAGATNRQAVANAGGGWLGVSAEAWLGAAGRSARGDRGCGAALSGVGRMSLGVLCLVAALLSWCLTIALEKRAERLGLVQQPNHRSS